MPRTAAREDKKITDLKRALIWHNKLLRWALARSSGQPHQLLELVRSESDKQARELLTSDDYKRMPIRPYAQTELFLGDGLYVRYDGYAFWLRASREGGDHIIVLEPNTLDQFARMDGTPTPFDDGA